METQKDPVDSFAQTFREKARHSKPEKAGDRHAFETQQKSNSDRATGERQPTNQGRSLTAAAHLTEAPRLMPSSPSVSPSPVSPSSSCVSASAAAVGSRPTSGDASCAETSRCGAWRAACGAPSSNSGVRDKEECCAMRRRVGRKQSGERAEELEDAEFRFSAGLVHIVPPPKELPEPAAPGGADAAESAGDGRQAGDTQGEERKAGEGDERRQGRRLRESGRSDAAIRYETDRLEDGEEGSSEKEETSFREPGQNGEERSKGRSTRQRGNDVKSEEERRTHVSQKCRRGSRPTSSCSVLREASPSQASPPAPPVPWLNCKPSVFESFGSPASSTSSSVHSLGRTHSPALCASKPLASSGLPCTTEEKMRRVGSGTADDAEDGAALVRVRADDGETGDEEAEGKKREKQSGELQRDASTEKEETLREKPSVPGEARGTQGTSTAEKRAGQAPTEMIEDSYRLAKPERRGVAISRPASPSRPEPSGASSPSHCSSSSPVSPSHSAFTSQSKWEASSIVFLSNAVSSSSSPSCQSHASSSFVSPSASQTPATLVPIPPGIGVYFDPFVRGPSFPHCPSCAKPTALTSPASEAKLMSTDGGLSSFCCCGLPRHPPPTLCHPSSMSKVSPSAALSPWSMPASPSPTSITCSSSGFHAPPPPTSSRAPAASVGPCLPSLSRRSRPRSAPAFAAAAAPFPLLVTQLCARSLLAVIASDDGRLARWKQIFNNLQFGVRAFLNAPEVIYCRGLTRGAQSRLLGLAVNMLPVWVYLAVQPENAIDAAHEKSMQSDWRNGETGRPGEAGENAQTSRQRGNEERETTRRMESCSGCRTGADARHGFLDETRGREEGEKANSRGTVKEAVAKNAEECSASRTGDWRRREARRETEDKRHPTCLEAHVAPMAGDGERPSDEAEARETRKRSRENEVESARSPREVRKCRTARRGGFDAESEEESAGSLRSSPGSNAGSPRGVWHESAKEDSQGSRHSSGLPPHSLMASWKTPSEEQRGAEASGGRKESDQDHETAVENDGTSTACPRETDGGDSSLELARGGGSHGTRHAQVREFGAGPPSNFACLEDVPDQAETRRVSSDANRRETPGNFEIEAAATVRTGEVEAALRVSERIVGTKSAVSACSSTSASPLASGCSSPPCAGSQSPGASSSTSSLAASASLPLFVCASLPAPDRVGQASVEAAGVEEEEHPAAAACPVSSAHTESARQGRGAISGDFGIRLKETKDQEATRDRAAGTPREAEEAGASRGRAERPNDCRRPMRQSTMKRPVKAKLRALSTAEGDACEVWGNKDPGEARKSACKRELKGPREVERETTEKAKESERGMFVELKSGHSGGAGDGEECRIVVGEPGVEDTRDRPKKKSRGGLPEMPGGKLEHDEATEILAKELWVEHGKIGEDRDGQGRGACMIRSNAEGEPCSTREEERRSPEVETEPSEGREASVKTPATEDAENCSLRDASGAEAPSLPSPSAQALSSFSPVSSSSLVASTALYRSLPDGNLARSPSQSSSQTRSECSASLGAAERSQETPELASVVASPLGLSTTIKLPLSFARGHPQDSENDRPDHSRTASRSEMPTEAARASSASTACSTASSTPPASVSVEKKESSQYTAIYSIEQGGANSSCGPERSEAVAHLASQSCASETHIAANGYGAASLLAVAEQSRTSAPQCSLGARRSRSETRRQEQADEAAGREAEPEGGSQKGAEADAQETVKCRRRRGRSEGEGGVNTGTETLKDGRRGEQGRMGYSERREEARGSSFELSESSRNEPHSGGRETRASLRSKRARENPGGGASHELQTRHARPGSHGLPADSSERDLEVTRRETEPQAQRRGACPRPRHETRVTTPPQVSGAMPASPFHAFAASPSRALPDCSSADGPAARLASDPEERLEHLLLFYRRWLGDRRSGNPAREALLQHAELLLPDAFLFGLFRLLAHLAALESRLETVAGGKALKAETSGERESCRGLESEGEGGARRRGRPPGDCGTDRSRRRRLTNNGGLNDAPNRKRQTPERPARPGRARTSSPFAPPSSWSLCSVAKVASEVAVGTEALCRLVLEGAELKALEQKNASSLHLRGTAANGSSTAGPSGTLQMAAGNSASATAFPPLPLLKTVTPTPTEASDRSRVASASGCPGSLAFAPGSASSRSSRTSTPIRSRQMCASKAGADSPGGSSKLWCSSSLGRPLSPHSSPCTASPTSSSRRLSQGFRSGNRTTRPTSLPRETRSSKRQCRSSEVPCDVVSSPLRRSPGAHTHASESLRQGSHAGARRGLLPCSSSPTRSSAAPHHSGSSPVFVEGTGQPASGSAEKKAALFAVEGACALFRCSTVSAFLRRSPTAGSQDEKKDPREVATRHARARDFIVNQRRGSSASAHRSTSSSAPCSSGADPAPAACASPACALVASSSAAKRGRLYHKLRELLVDFTCVVGRLAAVHMDHRRCCILRCRDLRAAARALDTLPSSALARRSWPRPGSARGQAESRGDCEAAMGGNRSEEEREGRKGEPRAGAEHEKVQENEILKDNKMVKGNAIFKADQRVKRQTSKLREGKEPSRPDSLSPVSCRSSESDLAVSEAQSSRHAGNDHRSCMHSEGCGAANQVDEGDHERRVETKVAKQQEDEGAANGLKAVRRMRHRRSPRLLSCTKEASGHPESRGEVLASLCDASSGRSTPDMHSTPGRAGNIGICCGRAASSEREGSPESRDSREGGKAKAASITGEKGRNCILGRESRRPGSDERRRSGKVQDGQAVKGERQTEISEVKTEIEDSWHDEESKAEANARREQRSRKTAGGEDKGGALVMKEPRRPRRKDNRSHCDGDGDPMIEQTSDTGSSFHPSSSSSGEDEEDSEDEALRQWEAHANACCNLAHASAACASSSSPALLVRIPWGGIAEAFDDSSPGFAFSSSSLLAGENHAGSLSLAEYLHLVAGCFCGCADSDFAPEDITASEDEEEDQGDQWEDEEKDDAAEEEEERGDASTEVENLDIKKR
ncbi:hypothetical protein TGME49_306300 [Toxoplasma gondii ME49]|uniref:Uncharacterized protein n=2 Tax=Toxoplasma gondii TaxID=5811 RepID=A0A0F7V1E6_TOXGV|nr:hypothetical protein TGME49_306300 [Toxoplasma gondii ME49]EPT27454.1 hypothetical protein TGME49_306300 [Toxoplasma gondii ME49]ESS29011.1 hypothetical protein TGVEG_306300 [Toxoplasma gondii VEG]CEL76269.1 TPA: hypothetical protein BN1205_107760 [Toxoplasma gondii VEG]|eukprot:XP_002370392.2 hypothetical protein TGME49_306300 [Toxoplasma gondii ME49]